MGLPAACAARPYEVTLGFELYAADAKAGVVYAINSQGKKREIYRDTVRVANTGARLDSLRAALERRTPEGEFSPGLEQAFSRFAATTDRLPAWTGMLPDPTGRLWLRRESCYTESGFQTFDVITTAGQIALTVDVPQTYTVRAAYGDRLLIVREDALGVEYLEQYRVVRR